MLRRSFLKAVSLGLSGLVFVVLWLSGPVMCDSLLLARAVPDIITAPAPPPQPPPPPPPEICQVAPPMEIRQMAPPEDMRKVAPPPAAGGASTETAAAKAKVEPVLRLSSLGLSSGNPKAGELVFATATLKNSGSQSLAGVRVRFFLGQVQVGEKVVTVPAGGSATASVSFAAAPAGAQTLKVQADPGSGLATLALTRGLTVTGAAKTDVEDFTTPAKKGTVTAGTGAAGGQAPLSPQLIPFDKPLLAKKGTEIARQPGGSTPSGTGSPGSPPGSGPPGFQTPPKAWVISPRVSRTPPWGAAPAWAQATWATGIMGVPGQEDMPKTGLEEGIPQKPPFKFPGP